MSGLLGMRYLLGEEEKNDSASSIIDSSTSNSPAESPSMSEVNPSDDRVCLPVRFKAGNRPISISESESECSFVSNLVTSSFTRVGVEVVLPFLGDVRKIDFSGVDTAGRWCAPTGASSSFRFLVGVSGKGSESRLFKSLRIDRLPCAGCRAGSGEVKRFLCGESLDGSSRKGRLSGDLRLGVGATFVGDIV